MRGSNDELKYLSKYFSSESDVIKNIDEINEKINRMSIGKESGRYYSSNSDVILSKKRTSDGGEVGSEIDAEKFEDRKHLSPYFVNMVEDVFKIEFKAKSKDGLCVNNGCLSQRKNIDNKEFNLSHTISSNKDKEILTKSKLANPSINVNNKQLRLDGVWTSKNAYTSTDNADKELRLSQPITATQERGMLIKSRSASPSHDGTLPNRRSASSSSDIDDRLSQFCKSHEPLPSGSETDDGEFRLSQPICDNHEPFPIPPFFNLSPRETPTSPHIIVEEEFRQNPWAMLIATIFLTKTTARQARPIMRLFFAEFPTPYDVIVTDPLHLERFFDSLGLKKRAILIWKMSYQFVSANWRRASDLCGVGKYGEDAYRIFCLGHMDVDPNDRYLRLYIDWVKNETDFVGNLSREDSECHFEEVVSKYYLLTLRQ